jgi:DNA polymerase-4
MIIQANEIHNDMRIILHADLDAFFASVEQLDNPELRGKPVVVGGAPEGRGVVAAASYEARVFGVRSAMPMGRALRLCPDLIRVPLNFARYAEVSRQVMAIFRDVTPLVEPMSLDEAYLDVSEQAAGFEAARDLALALKRRVREETQLTVSIGVAANKSAAKIASDMDKPNGLLVVLPDATAEFLAPLPTRALPGVGPRAAQRLAEAGITTIGAIAAAESEALERMLGSRGPYLRALARGEDDRAVETDHERKSVGAERTFPKDLSPGEELEQRLLEVATEVSRRLKAQGVRAGTIDLKLRYGNFRTISRQKTLAEPVVEVAEIAAVARDLLERQAQPQDRFRLLGIHGSRLLPADEAQLRLWQREDGGEPAPRGVSP